MESDYEISKLCLSLKELSALTVVRLLLDASNIASVGAGWYKSSIDAQAIAAAKTLEVPESVKKLVGSLIYPVSDELAYWYGLHMSSKPILTQQGTLDMLNSAKNVLGDVRVDRITRFLLACAVCSEKHIYEIGRQLDFKERCTILEYGALFDGERYSGLLKWNRIGKYWLEAYRERVGEQFDGADLPQKTYITMLHHALRHCKDINVRFFLKKAKTCRMARHHIVQFSMSLGKRLELNYSPATICYMVSIVKDAERSAAANELSFSLLGSLTNWPYQRFFLEAANSLIGNLTTCQFWKLLHFIVQKMVSGYEDWDYREMFITFFHLGAGQREKSSLTRSCGLQVAIMVFISKDDVLVQFLLDQMSAEDKKEFLLGFETNSIFVNYLSNCRYDRLEMFVRACAMRQKDLLLKFKEESMKVNQKCPQHTRISKVKLPLSDSEWAAGLVRTGEIVDRIIAEECRDVVVQVKKIHGIFQNICTAVIMKATTVYSNIMQFLRLW